MSTGTAHSFVYPVRSLLTGNILPAAQGEQSPAGHQSRRRRRKRKTRGGRDRSPNSRHNPRSNDTGAEQSFATASAELPPNTVLNPPTSTSFTADNGNINDPDSLSLYTAATGTGPPLSEPSPRQPQNTTEDTSDVFSSSAADLETHPRSRHSPQVDLSDTSIVHLPPPRSTLRFSSCSSSQYTLPTPRPSRGSTSSSYEDDKSLTVNLEGEGSFAHTASSSSSVGSDSDANETVGGCPSDEPLVTFRFEHREDGDGHHVVIGREGKLSRCEDEVRASFLYSLTSFLSRCIPCMCAYISL